MSEFEIREGDALEGIKALPAGGLDAVITDPPYCSGGFSESQRRQSTGQGLCSESVAKGVEYFQGDNMGTAGLVWMLRSLAFEAAHRLRPGGSMLVFTDWRQVANIGPAIESSGLRWSNIIVWNKGSMALGSGFRAQHEMCLHFTNGGGEYFDKAAGNVLTSKRVKPGDREHFAQKPIEVLRKMVRVVAPPGGLVVDPFCGSGSTGVAALLEGRRFLGFERDPKYCAVAENRCREATGDLRVRAGAAQHGLFGEADGGAS